MVTLEVGQPRRDPEACGASDGHPTSLLPGRAVGPDGLGVRGEVQKGENVGRGGVQERRPMGAIEPDGYGLQELGSTRKDFLP